MRLSLEKHLDTYHPEKGGYQTFVRLRSEGKSQEQIARHFDVALGTAHRWVKEHRKEKVQ